MAQGKLPQIQAGESDSVTESESEPELDLKSVRLQFLSVFGFYLSTFLDQVETKTKHSAEAWTNSAKGVSTG